MNNDKYAVYTKTISYFGSFEDAKAAWEEVSEYGAFLYDPNKTYWVGTLSSTGYNVGHDHMLHRHTAKCCGLFIAENLKQIKTFLSDVEWRYRSNRDSSAARLYGNGPYGFLYCSKTNREEFDDSVIRYYTDSNISYAHKLSSGYGALNVNTYHGCNPYNIL